MQKLEFIVYMAIEEKADSAFSRGLTRCSRACTNPQIQQSCFQMDRTRHLTLFSGKMLPAEAQKIQFPTSSSVKFEPIPITFEKGFNNWKAGLYLQTTNETTTKLKQLLGKLHGLPEKGGKRPWYVQLFVLFSSCHYKLISFIGIHSPHVTSQLAIIFISFQQPFVIVS